MRAPNRPVFPFNVRSGKNAVALALCLLTALAGPTAASRAYAAPAVPQGQGRLQISDEARQQIASLIAEKESRTPAQQKIDSSLLYAVKEYRGERLTPLVERLQTGLEDDTGDGRVTVDITARMGGTLYEQIVAGGGEIVRVDDEYNSMRALVWLDQMEEIAANEDVIFVQPEQKSMTQRTAPSPTPASTRVASVDPGFADRAARVRASIAAALPQLEQESADKLSVGSQNSQGDTTHKANLVRSMNLSDGAGVRIGVLSNGVVSLAASQALGDLPASVKVLPGQVGTGDEGTAMLEIIHDLAPKAQLYFATANPTIAAFASNIRDLQKVGCDIIVDDVFYYVETPFQDGQATGVVSNTNGGIVTQAVRDVTAAGVFFFSSAGNAGNKDDNTASCYQGDFVSGGTIALPALSAGVVHNFGGGAQSNLIQTGSGNPINLFWADPLGASSNDYDLFVLNNAMTTVVASSTNLQTGTQDPMEQVATGNVTNNRVVVLKKTAAANRFFHVTINANGTGRLATSTEGTTKAHSAVADAFSVAATPAASPGPFPSAHSASNVSETFSSDGPRRIFFNADGTPFTPGNFSGTGGIVRQKPDITAADRVSVTGVGGFPTTFSGTSAAAPHAAAIAALVKSAYPNLTTSQMRTLLTSTAIDIEAAGVDRTTGAGIIMPLEALQANGAMAGPLFDVASSTAAESVGGNANTFIEPTEGGSLNVTLSNAGLSATGISATLTTLTPGVTILSGTSSYPDVAGSGGTGTNATPFTFTTSSTVACDQTIQFVLTVAYSGAASPRALKLDVSIGRPPVTITTTIDATAPPASTDYTAVTGTQTGRVTRDGRASTCSFPKTVCPGVTAATNPRYDAYTFATCETGTANRCITVRLTTPCPTVAGGTQLFPTVYRGSFVPTGICTNYLADSGSSPAANGTVSFTFNVAAGESFVVVVADVPGTATNCNYTLTVSGLCLTCPTTTPSVQFGASSYSASEGAGTTNLTLTRTGDTSQPSTVSVGVTGGSAAAGSDYTNDFPKSVTFAATETTKTVPVTITDDTLYEPGADETITFGMSSVTNATIGSQSTTTLGIADNDSQPTVTLTGGGSVSEGGGSVVLTATLSNPTTQTVTVSLGFSGAAMIGAGNDYTAAPNPITIAPLGTAGTVTLTINDDASPEGDETIVVDVTSVTNATESGSQQQTVTILDNDCSITCPANVTTGNDTNQCGAVVSFPTPTTSGNCGTVTCSPTSGSFFPVGTTTVTCSATSGPSCSFTVTVNDTQAPVVTPSGDRSVVATSPNGMAVTFAAPTATDNCGAPTVTCSPASGSTFPIGTTTVTCTATDAAANSSAYAFTVSVLQRDTVGIYMSQTSAWFLHNTNTLGAADLSFTYGGATELVPLRGDWDGDGVDTPGLYDPVAGAFYLKNASAGGNADLVFNFGAVGIDFLPVVGDWNGDGVDTIGVFNPGTGAFFLKNSNAGGAADATFVFGVGGRVFVPVAGDWNGDGSDTVGLYNPATGQFFLKNANGAGAADVAFTFGTGGDAFTPVVGDWNADGADSVGIYRMATAAFFLRDANASGPADYTFSYGPMGAVPLAGNWDGN